MVNNPVQQLLSKAAFPKSGDFFAVAFIDREVTHVSFDGVVTKTKFTDRSYRDRIFQCLSSDATRVVGRIVHGFDFSDGKNSHIFFRDEWRMDDVKHLLPSLGFAVSEEEENT